MRPATPATFGAALWLIWEALGRLLAVVDAMRRGTTAPHCKLALGLVWARVPHCKLALGLVWARVGPVWGRLGPDVGLSWAVLSCLGLSWAALGYLVPTLAFTELTGRLSNKSIP